MAVWLLQTAVVDLSMQPWGPEDHQQDDEPFPEPMYKGVRQAMYSDGPRLQCCTQACGGGPPAQASLQ